MPRLRLLADLAQAQASGLSGVGADGAPVYDVAPGELVPLTMDATGWAGGSTVSASDWDADSGVTLSAKTLAGAVASCQAFIPDTADRRAAYWVQNTMTLSTGPVRKTLVWLRAADRG